MEYYDGRAVAVRVHAVLWVRHRGRFEANVGVPLGHARLFRSDRDSPHGKLRRHPTGMLDQRHPGRRADIDGRRSQLVHLQLPEPGDVRVAAGRMKAWLRFQIEGYQRNNHLNP